MEVEYHSFCQLTFTPPPPPPPQIRLAVASFKIALVSIRKPLRLKNHVFSTKNVEGVR